MWESLSLDELSNWEKLASDLATTRLNSLLKECVLINDDEVLASIITRSLKRAGKCADYRLERVEKFPGYFAHKFQFCRWFSEVAAGECLRLVFLLPQTTECLKELAAEHNQILYYLYFDKLSFRQVRKVLYHMPIIKITNPEGHESNNSDSLGDIIKECHRSYLALRGRIAEQFGERSAYFPPPLAADGHVF